jgi:hypothetical protein
METGGKSLTRDESGGCPDYGPDGIRHDGGVTLNRAIARNVGTCRPDAKGAVQAGGPREDWSTNAGHRGGAARSREEGSAGTSGRKCAARGLATAGDAQRSSRDDRDPPTEINQSLIDKDPALTTADPAAQAFSVPASAKIPPRLSIVSWS